MALVPKTCSAEKSKDNLPRWAVSEELKLMSAIKKDTTWPRNNRNSTLEMDPFFDLHQLKFIAEAATTEFQINQIEHQRPDYHSKI